MSRHKSVVGLALAVLATMGLVGSAVAGDQVPLRGSVEGTVDASGYPTFVVNAAGHSSHLGQCTLTMPHIVIAATMTAAGTFELVAANGDTIVGTMTGSATPTGTPLVFSIVEAATITGGTGRFAGATGALTIERLYDRGSGATSGSFSGSVSSPGSAD